MSTVTLTLSLDTIRDLHAACITAGTAALTDGLTTYARELADHADMLENIINDMRRPTDGHPAAPAA